MYIFFFLRVNAIQRFIKEILHINITLICVAHTRLHIIVHTPIKIILKK